MQSQKRPFTKLQIQQSIFYNTNNDGIKKAKSCNNPKNLKYMHLVLKK